METPNIIGREPEDVPLNERPPAATIHRAKWVLAHPDRMIEDGAVAVVGGVVVSAEPWGSMKDRSNARVTDHGPGLLMAGTVNAHTHTELSALKARLPAPDSFLSWVRSLIRVRGTVTPEQADGAAMAVLEELLADGTAFVADVGAGLDGLRRLERVGLPGVFFMEVLGLGPVPVDPLRPPVLETDPCRAGLSLAGHAPHTTPPEVLVRLKKRTLAKGVLWSLHLAESPEEDTFIRTGKGAWADFLVERGIPLDPWTPAGKSPVEHVSDFGLLDPGTLVVHLTGASPGDLERIRASGCRVCVCPRSNRNLIGRLPPIEDMDRIGIEPALGTDSLASVDDLHVWSETAFLARMVPSLAPRRILAMATIHGARALGVHRFLGDLAPRKKARMAFVHVDGATAEHVLEKAVSGDWQADPVTVPADSRRD